MFQHSPQQFTQMRTAIQQREMERLRDKHDNPRVQEYYSQLKAKLEAKFQQAHEKLEAGWDVSYICIDCDLPGYSDDEEEVVSYKLLKELREAGFKADIQYPDDLDGPNFFSTRSRLLMVEFSAT